MKKIKSKDFCRKAPKRVFCWEKFFFFERNLKKKINEKAQRKNLVLKYAPKKGKNP